MARTIADLPSGSRITDYVSLGVIAKTFPLAKTLAILKATQKSSVRQRDLPAHVVVYYVIALALYRSEEHTSELQSLRHIVCRLLLEKNTEIHANEEAHGTTFSQEQQVHITIAR